MRMLVRARYAAYHLLLPFHRQEQKSVASKSMVMSDPIVVTYFIFGLGLIGINSQTLKYKTHISKSHVKQAGSQESSIIATASYE